VDDRNVAERARKVPRERALAGPSVAVDGDDPRAHSGRPWAFANLAGDPR
jgi:hypothetical protein